MYGSDIKFCGYGVCRVCDGMGEFATVTKNDNSTAIETERQYINCLWCKGTGQEPFVPIFVSQRMRIND